MDLTLGGTRVLVTAGANGIGRDIARAFVAEGARVHVCDVDAAALDALCGTDPQITTTVCDVSDRAAVDDAVDALHDPEASAEALRHVLVGGVPSVDAFAAEVAEAEGGDPIPAHQVTKIIGEVLAEIDS